MTDQQRDWAIVLFATRGLAAFVENALIGIQRCGIDTGLVHIVVPADTESELGPLARAFGARLRLLDQLVEVKSEDMPPSYVEWDTPAFNRLTHYRMPALRAILAEGHPIIYADIDVAWLRNPLPYLARVLAHYPWAFQTESSPDFPPNFCLGFFAVSATPESFEIMDLHIASSRADNAGRADQVIFYHAIEKNPQYLLKIFPLPEGLFSPGLLYRSVGSNEEPPVPMAGKSMPFIFHGNWCIGLESKQRLLGSVGAWFVPETMPESL
jgi:hypothetical protein